jgi:amino acid adenylation domain-containing protein
MVPSAFVTLQALPLTPNGKVDRKALPAPEYAGAQYVAPRTATEEKLAAIWAEVLKRERVGVNDNFFELGGHSLLAVTLIERMRRAGLHADVRALFTTPTLAELAQAVGGESDTVAVPPNLIPANCEAITPQMLPLVALTPEEIGRVVQSVPGGAPNIQDIYPLAPLQEGILFHHLMAREGDPYLLCSLVAFDSRSRLDNYLRALRSVIERHDILRTAVVWEGLSEPVQVVWRSAPLAIEEVKLDPSQGDIARQLAERFDPRRYRLDVSQAPLLRIFLAEDRANARWVMWLLVHHLAIDHTALEVVQQEIQAYLLGQEAKLPAPLPFRNFVAQARLGVKREEHETYFKKLLGEVDEPTAPFGMIDVQGDGSGITEARRAVDAPLARRLREKTRALGVSAASLCHLAYAQVLARVSGRDDVVFGTVLFGRMQGGEGAERVMGLFINTLPVRIRVGEAGVEESVRSTHAQLAQLMRHEHAPLVLAQRASAVAAPAPLFSSFLNYRHTPAEQRSPTADKAMAGIEVLAGEARSNYPLQFSIDDHGEGFTLTAKVKSPVDPQRVCDYMHAALEQLVHALETSQTAPLRGLEVLPESERGQLLVQWNSTARDYGREARIHRLIEQQAAATPDAIALEFEGQALSYAEMNQRANQLARLLRRKGVGPDVLVGVLAERSIEMVLALLAILKAGGAYVPLDPSYPAERLAHMLEDARVSLVLAQRHLAGQLPSQVGDVHLLDPSWAAYADEGREDPEDIGTPRDLAYVIFTSGSTGRPKGAMNEHRGVCNRLLWLQEEFGLTADDCVMQKTAISFDPSVREFFWPLLAGARLVIARPEGHLDTAYLVDLIRRRRITQLQFVPSMLRVFVEQEGVETCDSLKRVLCSGEALTHELQERFFARLPGVELHNLYGPTECSMTVGHWPCRRGDGHLTVPIGRPGCNVQLYVLDASLRPAPIGVAGELHIGGIQVGRGYAGRPELTAERFIEDPFAGVSGARLYKTGDLVRYRQDGAIEYLGRADFQVKFRGFRVELGEIEATLDAHPAVAQSVVIVREDNPGDQRLVAYVVAARADLSATELKQHLSQQLPQYMVPGAFVFLQALPLTSSGKVDRKALRAPGRSGPDESAYVAPRTDTEKVLAGIWAGLLGVERVGVHDDFFALGGHSLLATQVVSRVRQALGVELPVRELFGASTVETLAAVLETLARVGKSGDDASDRHDSEEFVV